MRKIALLYNPLSGAGTERRKAVIEAVAAVFRNAGWEVSSEPTLGPAEAGQQARRAADQGCDTVFAAGGDGTINAILQGLVGTPAVLGVIPLGTGNTLAHDLALPRNPVKAARAALSCSARRFPAGRIEYTDLSGKRASRYFTVAAGIGVDAHLFYRLNVAHKTRLGMAAYYAKATHLWLTDPLHYFAVEFERAPDGIREQAAVSEMLAVRIRNFGGVLREFARGASLDREYLRLVLFQTNSRLRYLGFIFRGLVGARWHINGIELADAVVARCTAKDPASAHRVFVEADGELIGMVPATITMVPDAFSMLVLPAWNQKKSG